MNLNIRRPIDIDNRDPEPVYEYLEARIDVLKRRISELEEENHLLRLNSHESYAPIPPHSMASEAFAPASMAPAR